MFYACNFKLLLLKSRPENKYDYQEELLTAASDTQEDSGFHS